GNEMLGLIVALKGHPVSAPLSPDCTHLVTSIFLTNWKTVFDGSATTLVLVLKNNRYVTSLAQNFVHIIFSTKDRRPMISEEIEMKLFKYLASTCNNLNCYAEREAQEFYGQAAYKAFFTQYNNLQRAVKDDDRSRSS
ncbi:MAG: hypothetical protein ABI477_22670, partial [Chryseolinea sp.]